MDSQMLTTIITVAAACLGCMAWINRKFDKVNEKLNNIEKEIVAIKTIVFAHGMIVPSTKKVKRDE